jgi:hypothetical protein
LYEQGRSLWTLRVIKEKLSSIKMEMWDVPDLIYLNPFIQLNLVDLVFIKLKEYAMQEWP